MPDAVERPAPVSMTTRLARRQAAASVSRGEGSVMGAAGEHRKFGRWRLGSQTHNGMGGATKRTVLSTLTMVLLLTAAPAARAGGDWNEAGVAWKGYDEGVALAKKEKKPICLIFFTEWCPHCKNYSGVFHDDKVVETSKKFVMIRLDKDKNQEVSKKFAP